MFFRGDEKIMYIMGMGHGINSFISRTIGKLFGHFIPEDYLSTISLIFICSMAVFLIWSFYQLFVIIKKGIKEDKAREDAIRNRKIWQD